LFSGALEVNSNVMCYINLHLFIYWCGNYVPDSMKLVCASAQQNWKICAVCAVGNRQLS